MFLHLLTCGYFSYIVGIKEREQKSIYNYYINAHVSLESKY